MLDRDSLRARKNLINAERASRDEAQDSAAARHIFQARAADSCKRREEEEIQKIGREKFIYERYMQLLLHIKY